MRDQADKLRSLVRKTIKEHPRLDAGVPLLVVSGSGSGVGTSTIAIELVQQLAQLGKRAVLVDANPQQPDIASQFEIEAHGCISEILNGSRSAVEVLQPINESIQLLAGRWTQTAPPEINQEAVNRLVTELRTLHSKADFVVLDAGSGMSPWTAQLWQAAHQVLLVSNPDSQAIMDCYSTIKLSPYEEITDKLRLLVNRCDQLDTAQHWCHRLQTTCQQFLDLQINEITIVASNSQQHSQEVGLGASFQQSLRLLAADMLSITIVLSKKQPTKPTSFFQKMFLSRNKTQTV